MQLEQQLEILEELGVVPNAGITIDDFLYSHDRSEYERRPFDLVLFMMGVEVERQPWGRPFSDKVWNFDHERIYGNGDYVKIVKHLCRLAGDPDFLTDISDAVDFNSGIGRLNYRVGHEERSWTIEVCDDWVDGLVTCYVMADISRDNHTFWFRDNGQAQVLFYMDAEAAGKLNRLTSGKIKPML
jgi:hypothetical protein